MFFDMELIAIVLRNFCVEVFDVHTFLWEFAVFYRDLSGTRLTAVNASILEGMPSLQRLYVVIYTDVIWFFLSDGSDILY